VDWTRARKLLAVAALIAVPAVTWAQTGATTGATGVSYGLQPGLANTPHDFTSTATNGDAKTKFVAGTGGLAAIGLCTYCHTPHKAQTTQLLWNHTLSTQTFSWSDAKSTTAGTALPSLVGNTYKGPSTKCLSCHDGTVAIGDVSLFAETPRAGTSALNTTTLSDPTLGSAAGEFQIAGAGGSMNGNHPVGVPYPTGGGTYNAITTGTGINLAEWISNPVAVNNSVANVRLFTQDANGDIHAIAPGTTAVANAGIECSSCHDPHNKQATDDFFLRGHLAGNTTADGYLCLQCHQK
jgi:hypothetical protein